MEEEIARPDLTISYVPTLPEEILNPLVDAISGTPLILKVDRREPEGPLVIFEWLLATGIVVFFAKPYVYAFLQEAGKDHYNLIKKGLKSLWPILFGKERTWEQRFITAGRRKVSEHPKYSRALSLVAEAGPNLTFKMLLDDGASEEELDSAVESFLVFLGNYYAGDLDSLTKQQVEAARPMVGMVFFAYEPGSGGVRIVDPRNPDEDQEDGN